MSGFLIYIPKANFKEQSTGGIPHPLAQVGLGTLEEGAMCLPVHRGPDGGAGALYGWTAQFGYEDPEKHPNTTQEWVRSAKNGEHPVGAYWVGVWTDRLPEPHDLLRKFPRRGATVPLGKQHSLGDNNLWNIPALHELPQHTILDLETGSYNYFVASEYQQLAIETQEWVAYLADPTRWTPACDGRMIDFLVRVLGVNYRMTREVACYFLKLFYFSDIIPLIAMVAGLAGLELKQPSDAGVAS